LKAELEQERQGHQKDISDENEFVGKVAGTSIMVNVAAGIIMPASLFFTVPMALLSLGTVADKADSVIKSKRRYVYLGKFIDMILQIRRNWSEYVINLPNR
jgi:hypothetical protein